MENGALIVYGFTAALMAAPTTVTNLKEPCAGVTKVMPFRRFPE